MGVNMPNFVEYIELINNRAQLKQPVSTYSSSKNRDDNGSDLLKNLIVEYGKYKHTFSVKLNNLNESNKFFIFNDLLTAALKQLFDKNGNFLPAIIQLFEQAGLDATQLNNNSYKNHILFFFIENVVSNHISDKNIKQALAVEIENATKNYDINIFAYMRDSSIWNKWNKLDIIVAMVTLLISIPSAVVIFASIAVPVFVGVIAVLAVMSQLMYIAVRPWNYLKSISEALMPTGRTLKKNHEFNFSSDKTHKEKLPHRDENYGDFFTKTKANSYSHDENSYALEEINLTEQSEANALLRMKYSQ